MTSPEAVPSRSLEAPRAADVAAALALWGVGLGFMVPSLAGLSALFSVVPSHRVDGLSRWYCRTQLWLTANRWRCIVHPDVDPHRPYIFAQNHTNHFDHVAMYNATPHFKQGLELESHFRYPVYGWFMKARGTIPVPKDGARRAEAVLAGMRREIEAGRSVLAFPEGTRTRDGRVGPFRRGIFYAAAELGVPVVPVAVTGAFDMMRKGSWLIRPGNQLSVYCDQPIAPTRRDAAAIDAHCRAVRAKVARRVDAYWRARGSARSASDRGVSDRSAGRA